MGRWDRGSNGASAGSGRPCEVRTLLLPLLAAVLSRPPTGGLAIAGVGASSFPGTIRKSATTAGRDVRWTASQSGSDGEDNSDLSASEWDFSDDAASSANEDATDNTQNETRVPSCEPPLRPAVPDNEPATDVGSGSHDAAVGTSNPRPDASSQPSAAGSATARMPNAKALRTLQKLRQMLDDTDYITSVDHRRSLRDALDTDAGKERNRPPPPVPDETIDRNPHSRRTPDTVLGTTSAVRTHEEPATDHKASLWNSENRAKYKRQQQGVHQTVDRTGATASFENDPYRLKEYQQKRILEQQQLQQRQRQHSKAYMEGSANRHPQRHPQRHPHSDHEENSDTDDGLGYTLPNLPIYLSDVEEDSDLEVVSANTNVVDTNVAATTSANSQTGTLSSPISNSVAATSLEKQRLRTQETSSPNHIPPSSTLPEPDNPTQAQAQSASTVAGRPQQTYATVANRPPPPPIVGQWKPNFYTERYTQPTLPSYGHPADGFHHGPHPPLGPLPYHPMVWNGARYVPYWPYQPPPTTSSTASVFNPTHNQHELDPYHHQSTSTHYPSQLQPYPSDMTPSMTASMQSPSVMAGSVDLAEPPGDRSVANAKYMNKSTRRSSSRNSTGISFLSMQKITTWFTLVAVLSYSSVSPRNIGFLEYNTIFYRNLRTCLLAMVPPLVILVFICDGRENRTDDLVSTFYNAVAVGYPLIFGLEIIAATIIRLFVFAWFEPNVFRLSPRAPLPLLPWLLRENRYKAKRITLFVADFLTSCVACPIIEEFCKLSIFRWTYPLPRNFEIVKRESKSSSSSATSSLSSKSRSRSKRSKKLKHVDGDLAEDTTNVNSYVAGMFVTCMGIKMTDAIRRICMYTKQKDLNQRFFAICRGFFPIHELCGVALALSLARRDVLGQDISLWRMMLPSVVFHGMAVFRGMKPIFKWNASTPWSEMQLSPNMQSASVREFVGKAFPKAMWLVVLLRVMGYCVKNYYMINRHAVKRTTTYAGKHSAFSAELVAAQMLQKSKEK